MQTLLATVNQRNESGNRRPVNLFVWLHQDFNVRKPKIRAETAENTLNIC
jgi:hypothetical protein